MSAERALLAALHAALAADEGVGALVGARIYDDPPPERVFPYVTLGGRRMRRRRRRWSMR